MKSSQLTTGKIYTDYDELIKRVEEWVDLKNPRIVGCEDSHVKARIVQRVVEVTNEEYTQHSIKHANILSQSPGQDSGLIVVGGLRICTKTGRVKISPGQGCKNIALFFISWLYLLMFLVAAIFRRSPHALSAVTLLMEGGGYEDDDSRFVRFCRQGPIDPLSTAKHIIVRTKIPPRSVIDPSFSYTSQPINFLISRYLCRSTRFSILIKHLGTPFFYLKTLFNCSVNVLISRDLAVVPIVRLMDSKKLIDAILVTTSAFASQSLWMKGLMNQQFKLHMIWYSQNFIPKTYIGEKTNSNLPAARHMRVDVHWVWTEGFKSYLRELKQTSQIKVVGPLLWYLPEKKLYFGDSCIKVAVFDITPVPDERTVFGAAKNYYSVSTIEKFMLDIISICDDITTSTGKNVLVLLKHKRMPIIGRHDSTYLKFLERLISVKTNFKMIDHRTNLFDLLEECDLSISVPYTSTAYVAASIKKPGIYYDPFAELVPRYEVNEFISFASGPIELRKLMESALPIGLGFKCSLT